MEKITNKNFDKKCKLVKIGYKIRGKGDCGFILNKFRTPAVASLFFICGGCEHNGSGCQPNACEDSKTEIDAKVS